MSIMGCDMTSSAEADADDNVAIDAPRASDGWWWVALYRVELRYGGPEEGGWFYTAGDLVTDHRVLEDAGLMPPTAFGDDKSARSARMVMQAVADETLNKGLRPLSSVLSTGRYEARIERGVHAPMGFPARRPIYE